MCTKNTDTADIETKGFCHYKFCNGIKRHILVDVLGNPYFLKCTPANTTDDQGLLDIITQNKEYFINLPPNHIITILLDNGYHKEYLEREISKIDPQLQDKIDIQISDKNHPTAKN
jgi:Transposase DDE domain